MIDDTKTAAPNLPDDVKSWMDKVYRSLAEGIASQRVNAFSLILTMVPWSPPRSWPTWTKTKQH